MAGKSERCRKCWGGMQAGRSLATRNGQPTLISQGIDRRAKYRQRKSEEGKRVDVVESKVYDYWEEHPELTFEEARRKVRKVG